MVKEFAENSQGVHLISELNPEYTICGDAFDGGTECDGEDHHPTTKRVVTCPRCIKEIKNCRGVRIKEQE